jgi:hypothetical protein
VSTKIHNNRTDEAWAAFLAARDAGGEVEISYAIWHYFLGVLPPCWMNERKRMSNGDEIYCAFGQAEGFENVTAFYTRKIDGQEHYYCQLTNEFNPKAW